RAVGALQAAPPACRLDHRCTDVPSKRSHTAIASPAASILTSTVSTSPGADSTTTGGLQPDDGWYALATMLASVKPSLQTATAAPPAFIAIRIRGGCPPVAIR